MFNEDWYSNSQCQNLIDLVKKTKELIGSVIEVGCWEGKSTTHIANECYPNILICNDTWLGNVNESNVTSVKHPTEIILETRDVYSTFIKNMNLLTKSNYVVKKQDCIKFLQDYNEPIKFIHIDASHDYDSVYNTIKLVLPNMVKGGVICGDDFLSANKDRLDLNGGVERAVSELLPNYKNIDNLWFWIC
jgi:predicted O-methyltransferase YrrM